MNDMRTDWFARTMAGLALAVSLVAVFFEYAQSPLYPSRRPSLMYWQNQKHNGQTEDGRFDGATTVHLRNASSITARDVRVVVWSPCDRDPELRCLESIESKEVRPGLLVIYVPLVPANSTVEIEVLVAMERPVGKNPWLGEPWLEAPMVQSVYLEHGDVPCLYERCTRNFTGTGFAAGIL